MGALSELFWLQAIWTRSTLRLFGEVLEGNAAKLWDNALLIDFRRKVL
jgi:hypothetical protein